MDVQDHGTQGKFSVGQIVWHEDFNYRAVVYDVDPRFMLPDEVYDKIAPRRASREQPWYRLLVDGTDHEAYVAEQHLREMLDAEPIEHAAVDQLFSRFEGGRYWPGFVMH